MFSRWLAAVNKRVSEWFVPDSPEYSKEASFSGEDFKIETPDLEIVEIEEDAPTPILLSRFEKFSTTPIMAKDYALALNQHYNAQLSQRLLAPLLAQEFQNSSAWFDDDLINNYFLTLTKPHSRLYYVDSVYVGYKNPDFFERLRKNSRFKARIENDFKQADLIFWPIPVQQHWHLLIIDKSKKPIRLYWLDGMNKKEVGTKTLSDYGMKILKILQPECLNLSTDELRFIVEAVSITIPSQKNSYDCGSVICWWGRTIAEHFMVNGMMPLFNSNPIDYTAFRLEIAQSLIAASDQVVQSTVLGKRSREHI